VGYIKRVCLFDCHLASRPNTNRVADKVVI
jgi:hypothetical protein